MFHSYRHITAHIIVSLRPYHLKVMSHIMANCKMSNKTIVSSLDKKQSAAISVLFSDVLTHLLLYNQFIGASILQAGNDIQDSLWGVLSVAVLPHLVL